MTDINNATREVFGNIVPWMRVVFFIMIAAASAVLVWQLAARIWLWRKGQKGGFEYSWRVWIRRLAVYAAAQKRVHKKSLGALLHLLLFSGFVVLTIGTTLRARSISSGETSDKPTCRIFPASRASLIAPSDSSTGT